MKRALVTGSRGLVGRHMSAELARRGWDVTGIDIRTPGPQVDARVFFAQAESRFDLVVHCAAHVGGRLDIENKAAYIAAYNAQLDGAMFEWCLQSRPAHVMYWSSSAAYPTILQSGFSDRALVEDDIDIGYPAPADQTYGWCKLIGERMAVECIAEGIKVHIFRPFSGWAVDQDPTYPMPALLGRALRKDDPFQIWGYGTQVRDFIHMRDVIGASLAAVEADYPMPMNLCTGRATSFIELAGMMCRAMGYQPGFEFLVDKPQGVAYRVGDPTEMNKVWQIQTTLEDDIAEALSHAQR
jgi:nucleoside-diphosphate-sugar epimerase